MVSHVGSQYSEIGYIPLALVAGGLEHRSSLFLSDRGDEWVDGKGEQSVEFQPILAGSSTVAIIR